MERNKWAVYKNKNNNNKWGNGKDTIPSSSSWVPSAAEYGWTLKSRIDIK